MDRIHVTAASGALFLVLLACKGAPTSTSSDAGAAPVASTTVAATASTPSTASAAPSASAPKAPTVANESDVARFPDEKKLDEEAVLQWSSSKVRKKPQGDPVVSLAKGTSVTKIAERQGFFLITFADPKDASKRLEGWVYKDAFNAEVPLESEPLAGNKCPAGAVFREDAATGKHCNRACASDAQCGTWVCYHGACISPQGE